VGVVLDVGSGSVFVVVLTSGAESESDAEPESESGFEFGFEVDSEVGGESAEGAEPEEGVADSVGPDESVVSGATGASGGDSGEADSPMGLPSTAGPVAGVPGVPSVAPRSVDGSRSGAASRLGGCPAEPACSGGSPEAESGVSVSVWKVSDRVDGWELWSVPFRRRVGRSGSSSPAAVPSGNTKPHTVIRGRSQMAVSTTGAYAESVSSVVSTHCSGAVNATKSHSSFPRWWSGSPW
jgi:hypothetical protein